MLKGRTAVITGGSRGIGKKTAEIFAAEGADLFLCARTMTEEFAAFCGELAEECSVAVTPLAFDLSDPDQIRAGAGAVFAAKTPVHILVNNAGITHSALFRMTAPDDLRRVMEVNFYGPFLLTQYLLRRMPRDAGANIINIVSTAGIDCNAGKSAYAASKAALIAMTKTLARELAPEGIRVNAIAPGATETEMFLGHSEEIVNEVRGATALGRLGTPEDIAGTAAFLASGRASHITGQVIRVDGGFCV